MIDCYNCNCVGDAILLRKFLKLMAEHQMNIDKLDYSGMSALHWSVMRGHEICTRLLLDRGSDVDVQQGEETNSRQRLKQHNNNNNRWSKHSITTRCIYWTRNYCSATNREGC